MGGIIRFICLAILLGLIGKGTGQCGHKNITVKEVPTGAIYYNKPQWAVTITNECDCTQNRFSFDCPGFKFAEMVDPQDLVFSPTYCYIRKPIYPHSSINFTYVYDFVGFKPLDSTGCVLPLIRY